MPIRALIRPGRAGACAALLFMLTGCASRGAPVPELISSTSADAMSGLLRISREWQGIRSFLKVQLLEPGGRRRFSARLQVDAEFRMRLEGMTPLGTTAFVLWADAQNARFVNHLNRTVWSGSFAELSRSLGLGSEMTVRDLVTFLLALPDPSQQFQPCVSLSAGDQCSSDGVWRISLTPAGASVIERKGEIVGIRSEYFPPAFPPQRLEITARNAHGDQLTTLNVEHLEVTASPGRLTPPEMDPAYRCCPPPVLSESSDADGERP